MRIPTGAVLSAESRVALVEAARESGAWLLADQVYRGAGCASASAWSARAWRQAWSAWPDFLRR